MVGKLHYVKDLGYRSRDALRRGDTRAFGTLMHEHWEHKKATIGRDEQPSESLGV